MASLQARLSDLIMAIGSDYKYFRTLITGSANGDLTGLHTTAKGDIVSAINELADKPAYMPVDGTTTQKGVVQLATLQEVGAGTSTTKVVTPEGVRQERIALKTEILGGAGAAYDTLKELQDLINQDESDIMAIYAALANRVRVDTAAQGLSAVQQANARTNIDVYGTAAFGNPDTDLVALYTTAKT